jgi:hypothetical protein
MTLLEGQEDGEVEALMEDAKEWLDQWFKEIRPWDPKDIDLERLVWVRIYGVPVHAWNFDFFSQVAKPWGILLNTDDATSKKISMDVARLLIRTSSQRVVDEFFDVNINGVLFHLRALEDSYGPMRIMVPQPQVLDGRTAVSVTTASEDGEEDDGGRRLEEEEESERESEGEGENLLALNSAINNNHSPLFDNDHLSRLDEEREKEVENSVFNLIENSIHLIHVEGGTVLEGGATKEGNLCVEGSKSLGQEVGIGGPTCTTSSHKIITGGVVRRKSKSADLGCFHKSNFVSDANGSGLVIRKEGVYSDGPRVVYNKLNKGITSTPRKNGNASMSIAHSNFLPSSKLRKQQLLKRGLLPRKTISNVAASDVGSGCDEVVNSRRQEVSAVVIRRAPNRVTPNRASSLSSAGEILCCSSINSSDIRNCNQNFLKKYEQKVASKVWHDALKLGVEVTSPRTTEHRLVDQSEDACILEIQENEKRDEEESLRREHKKSLLL